MTRIYYFVTSLSLMVIWQSAVFAHCPVLYQSEKVCFMFDQNTLYVYDSKNEHNGPYKDLVAEIKFQDEQGQLLKHNRVASGIYKLSATNTVKKMILELKNHSKIQKISIPAE